MNPAERGMVLRKLEKIEEGQRLTNRQLNTIREYVKGLEADNEAIIRRMVALGKENEKILKELDHQSRMVEQLVRRGGRG